MAVQAAERVLELVQAAQEIGSGHREEVLALAHEDVMQMRSVHAYLYKIGHWTDYSQDDGTLRAFLTILYLVHLEDEGAELPLVVQRYPLIEFGRGLKAHVFEVMAEEDDIRGFLQELWKKCCTRHSVSVVGVSKPWTGYSSLMVASQPSRAPVYDLDFDVLDSGPGGSSRGSRCFCEESPDLFDLLKMVWKTQIFRALPSRVEGDAISKVLNFVQDYGYEDLQKKIVSLYSGTFYEDDDYNEGEDEDEEDIWFNFTAKEAIKILRGIKSAPLLSRLILERPPKSLLPHWMALMTCTEHARLWLARVDLNVYYEIDFTYAQLCTREYREAEMQVIFCFRLVLKSAFLCERAPSPLQRKLRLGTLSCLWNTLSCVVHNFRPEDCTGCEGSKLWEGIRKLGHPVALRQGEEADASIHFKPVASCYTKLLEFEDKTKLGCLFSKTGPPSKEEIEEDGSPIEASCIQMQHTVAI